MKAEEEEVAIDTYNTTGPSTSTNATRSAGPGTGVVTPILSGTNGGNGTAALAVDGALGKLGSNSGDLDLDIAWAEEEPDDDDPGVWRMKVAMENEEIVGYWFQEFPVVSVPDCT